MKLIDVIGSRPGRVLRIAAGAGIIMPLVHGPLRGAAFRQCRRAR